MFREGKHERMMTVMLTSELEVQRRLQHPLRHRYAWLTKVSIHQQFQGGSCVGVSITSRAELGPRHRSRRRLAICSHIRYPINFNLMLAVVHAIVLLVA
jgi:hypothetical protein